MKRKIAVLMGLVAVVLTGGVVLVSIEDDREGPDITFEKELVYTGAEDISYLLEGVRAEDEKDGDVTDSLRVEKVQVNEEEQEVVIVYIAKDSKNNVTKISVTIPLDDIGALTQESSDAETAQTFEEATTEVVPEPTLGVTPEPTPEAAVLSGEAENEAKIAALPQGCPAFYLVQYEEKLAVGSSFDVLSYVKDITDDVDDRNWLFQHIQVLGEVNTYTQGTYEVIYYVIDSNGNQSNEALLTVIVE